MKKLLIFLVLALLFSAACLAQPVLVQTSSAQLDNQTGTTLTPTFPSAVTNGNAVILYLYYFQSGNLPSSVSGGGNTFTLSSHTPGTAAVDDGQNDVPLLYYCLSCAGGFTAISVQPISTNDFIIAVAQEWSGLQAEDVGNSSHALTASAIVSGSITPSSPNDLVVAAEVNDAGNGVVNSSGWTAVPCNTGAGGDFTGMFAYIIPGNTSSQQATWDQVEQYSAAIESFSPSGGGPAPAPKTLGALGVGE